VSEEFAQIPPSVAALLREGQAALQNDREATRLAELAAQRAERVRAAQQAAAILAAARRLLPEALHGYLSFAPDQDPNASTTYCLLMVPGCVPVRVQIGMTYCKKGEWDAGWYPTETVHPQAKLLTLPRVELGAWTFYLSRNDHLPGDIGKVLAEARELEARRLIEQEVWLAAKRAAEDEVVEGEDTQSTSPAPVDPWMAACLKLGEAVCRLIDGRND